MSENKKDTNIEKILENSPKYPLRAAEDPQDVIMEDVYAGPEMLPDEPSETLPETPPAMPPEMPIAMATYMGPAMMNNSFGMPLFFTAPAVQNTAPAEKPSDHDSKFCAICGSRNSRDSRFCCECGNPFPKIEESDTP